MKQLLIVKTPADFSNASPLDEGLTSNDVTDLSGLKNGAISLFELGAATSLMATAAKLAKKNFAIALGRPNGQMPFIIPEVDINTLEVTKALPMAGKAFKRKFTFPTPSKHEDYTIIFVKKDALRHERNTWTCTINAKTETAATEATALKNEIENKLGDVFTVSVVSDAITITAKNIGEQWEAKLADGLFGVSFAGSTDFVDAAKPIGDKAFIVDLASRCAAGKGFTETDEDILPGYPEDVQEFTLNTSGTNGNGLVSGCSTTGYALYTLRFKVGRDAAKTRDERVWQVVHIAIPVDSTATYNQIADMDTMLPEGNYGEYIAKTVADQEVKTLVKSAYLN